MKGNPDAFRPLQIVHDFRFTPIGMKEPNGWPEGADEAAKRACVAARLARLKALGFGGVVINVDFDRYLEDEAAWERFLFAFDEAVALGLRVWIYDEQYYPSGLAGGLVLRDHPEWEAQALCCVARDAAGAGAPVRVQSPYGHGSLRFAFAVPRDADGALRFDRTAGARGPRAVAGGADARADAVSLAGDPRARRPRDPDPPVPPVERRGRTRDGGTALRAAGDLRGRGRTRRPAAGAVLGAPPGRGGGGVVRALPPPRRGAGRPVGRTPPQRLADRGPRRRLRRPAARAGADARAGDGPPRLPAGDARAGRRFAAGRVRGAELRFGESFAEKSRTGLRLLGDAPSVLHLHKENGAEDLELLVQQRREPIRFAAELPGPFAALTAWFAETDREVPLEGRPAGGATRFELELPPYGAAIVARTRA